MPPRLSRRRILSAPLLLLCLVTITATTATETIESTTTQRYGQQCSFPITSNDVLDGCNPNLLDGRQDFYEHFMAGCYETYSAELCDDHEQARLEMNARQPQSMVNFTSTGYMKTRAPAKLMQLLLKFWQQNKHSRQVEEWNDGNIYTNHWQSPTYLVNVEQEESFVGAGQDLKDAIWNAALDGMNEWTQHAVQLRPTSLYGIRVYTSGAILNPHVDRIPLVTSAIINVDQNVTEPWPLEVYDRHGRAVNITMEPGDMVLYESHSLIHGRPFALKGEFMANVFVHFEPFDMNPSKDDSELTTLLGPGGELPPYVLENSPGADDYRETNPEGWSKYFSEADPEPKCNDYAANGMLAELQEMAALDFRLLHFEAPNGRTPLHEAIYGGHTDVLLYLVSEGVDINKRTHEGEGASPLNIARIKLGAEHDITKTLEQMGAHEIWSEVEGDEEHDFDEDGYDPVEEDDDEEEEEGYDEEDIGDDDAAEEL